MATSINLFKGLFEEVNRDYLNLLGADFVIENKQEIIRKKLIDLAEIFNIYGLSVKAAEVTDKSNDKDFAPTNHPHETGAPLEENGSVKGSPGAGCLYTQFRAKVKGYPLHIAFQFRQDYLNKRLNYIINISCAGYLQPEIHLPVEHILKSLKNLQFDGADIHFMRSKLIVVQPIEQIETFNPADLTVFLLDNFANRCAFANVSFLGLKVNRPDLKNFEILSNRLLDELSNSLQATFSNQVISERNWMKKYRYIDFVYSGKTVDHWLGWGLEWNGSVCRAGIIFHVSNSLKGASFKEQMERLASSGKGWEIITKAESYMGKPMWLVARNMAKLTSSSDYNRNYTAKQAYLVNTKKYWCAAKQDETQWWQVEVDKPLELLQIKLAGAPNGKNFTRKFNLTYSIDGKIWNTLLNLEGLESGDAIKTIDFESKIYFRFLRICPKVFQGWPGLRADICAQEITPDQVEVQWMIPINSAGEIKQIIQQLPEKIADIKQFKGIGI